MMFDRFLIRKKVRKLMVVAYALLVAMALARGDNSGNSKVNATETVLIDS